MAEGWRSDIGGNDFERNLFFSFHFLNQSKLQGLHFVKFETILIGILRQLKLRNRATDLNCELLSKNSNLTGIRSNARCKDEKNSRHNCFMN